MLKNKEMKKIILFFILIGVTIAGNAQYFVEWNMGISYQEEESIGISTYSPSFLTIEIMPRMGYWLSDGVAVGASPFFIWFNQKYPETPNAERIERTTQIWGLSVFGRYKLWGPRKLSVLGISEIDNGGGTEKGKTGSITNYSHSISLFRFNVYPAISYSLTDRLSIIARWEFLDLSFQSQTIKDKETNSKITINNFGFKTRSEIFGNISDISLGLTYNF